MENVKEVESREGYFATRSNPLYFSHCFPICLLQFVLRHVFHFTIFPFHLSCIHYFFIPYKSRSPGVDSFCIALPLFNRLCNDAALYMHPTTGHDPYRSDWHRLRKIKQLTHKIVHGPVKTLALRQVRHCRKR